MDLTKYLIEFEDREFKELYGVTAYTEQDALNLLRELIFTKKDAPKVLKITEIKSIDELDQGHIVPNMDEFISRGIWYPRLKYLQG